MAKPFVSLSHVLSNAVANETHRALFLKDRPVRYKFGLLNYGEITGWYNRADGDCWDVFAPGYTRPLPVGREYLIKDIIGVLELNNGNHKIAVRLFVPGYDRDRARRETERYATRYRARTATQRRWRDVAGF